MDGMRDKPLPIPDLKSDPVIANLVKLQNTVWLPKKKPVQIDN